MNEDQPGFKAGDKIENKEEFLVFSGDVEAYTIDYITDDGYEFEKIIVFGDEKLRNRIVDLLNSYGE